MPKESVASVVKQRAEHANLIESDFTFLGGNFGCRFAVRFTREVYANQLMASLRGSGKWEQDTVPSPAVASGSTVALYYSFDKTARQRRIDYAWRRFKAIVIKHAEPQSDSQCDLRFDARGRIIATSWREVCRLRLAEKEQITIAWKDGQQVFSPEQTKAIGEAFASAIDQGWG